MSKLENILCGPQSKLHLIRHSNIQNMVKLEDTIIRILSNNHLAYMSVDGAFQSGINAANDIFSSLFNTL